MASTFIRSVTRASLSQLRPLITKPKVAAEAGKAACPFSSPSPTIRRSPLLSRSPVELGCCIGSLLPLHSAVAAARLTSRLSTTSRSCRDLSQDDGT
ncbi:hypothetical protein J5N97_029825 [Dioscorea zingiberensis]|uniref:Protein NUCLEAR FUSION DEFECTIVE 6, chloroplastic/mitochondrial-like n=1 Tax=Dioscorea zingiberensis TaxID=325984 RepID=A0A9D5H3J8_9LILI|nr:hypothetical protein J5N97_029825 [Dioscorea zingiberensis]